jgi:hypothetical protein
LNAKFMTSASAAQCKVGAKQGKGHVLPELRSTAHLVSERWAEAAAQARLGMRYSLQQVWYNQQKV